MTFTQPLFLLLLPLTAYFAYLGWPKSRYGRGRAWIALVLRCLIALLVVLSLAGIQSVHGGDELAITFDPPLVDVDRYTVDLWGMNVAGGGAGLVDPTFEVVALKGDIDGSLTTTTADALLTKLWFGQATDLTNWTYDYNNDGHVTTADYLQIKSCFGNAAP